MRIELIATDRQSVMLAIPPTNRLKRPRCISRGTLIPPSASNTFNSCYCFLRNRSLYLHRLLHGTQTILLSLFVPSYVDLLYIIPGNSYFPARSVFYSSIQTMCC